MEFHIADVEVGAVVGDVGAAARAAARGEGADVQPRLVRDGHAGPPHVVRADPEKLRQILLNLLTNAVKFTDAGRARGARVRDRRRGRGGAAPRVATPVAASRRSSSTRIFEPFVQVDRHRTRESQQGVGLGLAISRDLARRMGGRADGREHAGRRVDVHAHAAARVRTPARPSRAGGEATGTGSPYHTEPRVFRIARSCASAGARNRRIGIVDVADRGLARPSSSRREQFDAPVPPPTV